MTAPISIPAIDIPIEGLAVELELTPGWLEATLADAGIDAQPGDESGTFSGRLSRSGQDIVVRGRVRVRFLLPCVRCLEPAAVPVDAEVSLLLQPVPRADTRNGGRRSSPGQAGAVVADYEFSAGEAARDVYDGETVVLDPFLREAILLEMPSFPLCSESCPGIVAPGSGPGLVATPVPAEIDPRLAPLEAFRAESDGPVTIAQLVEASGARSTSMGRKPVLRANRRGPSRAKRNKK
ncbi:MAG: DUF177 domain-containing protein [Deltaproteobacteria bacterium]|nr:MAG: DUF177 domain-containing protein [Deltaproteobacteria bacterium]